MKGSRIGYLPVLLLAGLCSCGVLFDKPMPLSTAPLAEFPAGIVGRYHLADSSFIDRKDTIYNATYYEQALPAKDSIVMFSMDLTIEKKLACFTLKLLMFCKSCPEEMPYKGRGYEALNHKDTKVYTRDGYTVHESVRIDTMVNLRKKDKLKYDGKAWYLNHFLSDQKAWEIYRLKALGKNNFSLSLTNAKDRKYLERFVVKKGIWAPTVHLTDEQFNAFVKQGGFQLRFKLRKYNP